MIFPSHSGVRFLSLVFRGFLLVGGLFAAPLWALNPVPYTEGVSFSFRITGTGAATLTVNDETGSPAVTTSTSGTTTESSSDTAWLRPGKQYPLNFAGSGAVDYGLSFLTPAGYGIYVDGIPVDLVPGSHSGGSFSDDHLIELRPVASPGRGDAACFSGIDLGKSVTWDIGLGGLRSGGSAGRILFKELDLVTNAPDSRERLYYAPPSNTGQITTIFDGVSNQTLRQIAVPQTVVDLVDDATYGGYWIKFYELSQASWGGSLYTFSGSPWKTIRVESPGTSQLKLTETEGSVARVSNLALTSGSIASGVYQWTLQEGDGSTWLRTTTHTSSIPTTAQRDDVVIVRTGGTSGTIVAKTKYHYETLAWGEEVTQVVADPDTAALTTSYDYFGTSTDYGNYRKVKSVTAPTGGWVSYLYYDDWDRRGQLAVETRPWLDTHSTVQAADIAVDNSVVHDYAPDFTGRFRIESTRENRIGYVRAGYTATSPTINLSQDGQMYTLYATDVSAGTSLSQHSESAVIDAGNGYNNPDYYGQPYSVKRPDLSQDSFTHHLGSFNYSTRGFTSPGDGSHFRTTVFHGTTSSSGTDSYTAYDGLTVAQIYLVPDRSTKEVTIRNPAGDVVRTETHVYTGSGSFTLMTFEDFTYDAAGRLLTRVAGNGAATTNTYTNGQLTSTVGVDGTETQFTYDLIGRVLTSVKQGAASLGAYAAQGDITTTNTYDGAGHLVQAVTSGGALSQTTTATYDLAGRITQTIAPGGYTTGFAYSSGGKIVTATLPGGATKITETYLDGQRKSVSGTGVVSEDDTFSLDGDGNQVRRAVLGGNTAGWTDLSRDWLSRPIDQASPGWNGTTVHQTLVYNSAGQLAQVTRPGLADTLYLYDILGRLYRQGLDVNGNGTLDLASDDRLTDSHLWIESYDSGVTWWAKTDSETYASSGSATTTQVALAYEAMNPGSGVLAESFVYDRFMNLTHSVTSFDRANKKVIAVMDTPDSTVDSEQITRNGLVMETTDATGLNYQYGYDALGRPVSSLDPRTGTTTTAYVSGTNQVSSVTDPANLAQASYTYDSAGRVASTTDALSKVCRYAYTDRNEKYRVWGDTDYPVEYAYNASGQQTSMKTYRGGTGWTGSTWPASPGTADTTTWAYQAGTNLLSSKTDASSHAVSFTYTQAGQVATRQWARILTGTTHVTSTYGYDATTGELLSVDYNDVTPDLTYTYNRLGQTGTVLDQTGTRSFTYNLAGTLELQHETLGTSSADFYGDRRITRSYDTTTGAVGRYIGPAVGPAAYPFNDYGVTYGYDSLGRLNSSYLFNYAYLAHSRQVESTSTSYFGGYTDLRTFETYHDWTSTRTTTVGSSVKAAFTYGWDNLGRVIAITQEGELFNRYGNGTQGLLTGYTYTDRSEVNAEATYLASSGFTVLPGRSDTHTYDSMGNRDTVTHNSNGAAYTTNGLNQYTQRVVPGVFDVAGAAGSSTTVTVNSSSSGVSRSGEYFFQSHALTNTSAPVSTTLAVSDGTTTTNLPAYLAKTAEVFTYDEDGNLLSDGRWNYTYDAENRIFTMETIAAAVSAGLTRQKLTFTYDYLGRRSSKWVQSGWTGSSYATTDLALRFIYDGWNLLYELDASGSLTPVRLYVWGLDQSGTLQGAGGVGGLLATYDLVGANWYLPTYDANGNLHAMIKASDGSLAAAYEYDAFGKTIRESGPYAASNPFRYSTKYTDEETGLVYYGMRYYSPSMGRFINRDPIEEEGGVNLYGFCRNNGVNGWDMLGRSGNSGGSGERQEPIIPGFIYEPDAVDTFLRNLASDNGAGEQTGDWTNTSIDLSSNGFDLTTGFSGYNAGSISASFWADAEAQYDAQVLQGQRNLAPTSINAGSSSGNPTFNAHLDPLPSLTLASNSNNVHAGGDGGIGSDGSIPGARGGEANALTPNVTMNGITLAPTSVHVGYNTVGGTLGLEHHGAILISNSDTGANYISEGGPAGMPSPGLSLDRLVPGANPLVASVRPWNPVTSTLTDFQFAGTINSPTPRVIQSVVTYNSAVNKSNIPYSGSSANGYNSNSYYSSALRFLNILPPVPPYSPLAIPGTQRTLPVHAP